MPLIARGLFLALEAVRDFCNQAVTLKFRLLSIRSKSERLSLTNCRRLNQPHKNSARLNSFSLFGVKNNRLRHPSFPVRFPDCPVQFRTLVVVNELTILCKPTSNQAMPNSLR
jgi:hypothetical protein